MEIPELGLKVSKLTVIDQRDVNIDSIRLIRKGRVKKASSRLLELLTNPPPLVPDEHPVCISENFAEQRNLKDGDHYVMVEYKNVYGVKNIDVWKVTGVLT